MKKRIQSSLNHVPGIDDSLSQHIAHLFIRDPLVVFSENIDQDDATSSDHFEVCTIWHTFILWW